MRSAFRHRCSGFTLIELLAVVGIILILAALLLPAIMNGPEKGRRVYCLSRVRGFIRGAHVYATNHNGMLPQPGTDNSEKSDTHTPIISTEAYEVFLEYMGDARAMDCAGLEPWFRDRREWREHSDYGKAIGYHYLGGHPNTPWRGSGPVEGTWVSPQMAEDDPRLVLVADLNVFCPSFRRILAPHCERGAVVAEREYFGSVDNAENHTPVDLGAEGGNVGLLDGSASWRDIEDLVPYRASHGWGSDGAFGMW